MSGLKNAALALALVFCSWQLFTRAGCEAWVTRPTAVARASEPIDLVHDPLQTTDGLPEPFQIERPQGRFTIQPVARYRISGQIVSIKRYYMDWESFLAPIDVGVAWGDVLKPEFFKLLSFDHGNRFLHWRYRPEIRLTQEYLVEHASNNHLIAKTPTLTRAIETMRTGEQVTLEGYLVNISGTAEGREIYWHTSTVRNDRGGGACEVIFLERLRIGDEIFE